MYNKKTVSVVIATYREKKSIKKVIEDFYKVPYIDEVIVVDNNAEPGTAEEVRKTKAKLFFEKKQGQGFALRRGMEAAKGDYLILCEADGSFNPRDSIKFLSYAEEFPVVLGTRTNGSLIAPDSAMFFFRRLADILEGKLIQLLFLSSTLTDVGCTYKLIRRDALKKLRHHWLTGDSHFVTEMTLQVVARRIPFIEIPIAFGKRIGESAVTGDIGNIVKWGWKLLFFILYFWARWQFNQLINVLRLGKFRGNISI